MRDVTIASAVTGLLELLRVAGPTAVALLIGFGMLRRQERVKRQEEHAAGVRKLQLDALVEILEAVGRYHTRSGLRRLGEDEPRAFRAVVGEATADDARRQEAQAREALTEVLARKVPLLAKSPADVLTDAVSGLLTARSSVEATKIVEQLLTRVAPWIPPLDPVSKDALP